MTPNQITLIRIFLVPFMIFFYLADFILYGKLIAVIIFAFAAITDFIDGRLARKTGQITDMGKFLDPIADKLLILGALVLVITDALVVDNWAIYATVIAFIILAREFLVTGLRQIASSKGFVIVADNWGKYKAFMQDLALPAFMLWSFFKQYSILTEAGLSAFEYICFVLIITATLLTIISGVNYFVKNKIVFAKTEAVADNVEDFGKIEKVNVKKIKKSNKNPKEIKIDSIKSIKAKKINTQPTENIKKTGKKTEKTPIKSAKKFETKESAIKTKSEITKKAKKE